MSNLSATEKKTLELIAKRNALYFGEGQKYCPKTWAEAENFETHLWVLKALENAYSVGKLQGIRDKEDDLRRKLGL